MITGVAVDDFRDTRRTHQGGQLLLGQRYRFRFVVNGNDILGLGSVLALFNLHRIGVIHRGNRARVRRILGQFLAPQLELPLIQVLKLGMGKGHHLHAFGTFTQVEYIETVAITVFQTASERAPGNLFRQFVVPVLFCGFDGHAAVGLDGINAISGIGSAGDSDIHLLGLVPRSGFLQLQKQLVDGILIARTCRRAVRIGSDGQDTETVSPELVHAEELRTGESPVLLLGTQLCLLIRFLNAEEHFLDRHAFHAVVLFFFLHKRFVLWI